MNRGTSGLWLHTLYGPLPAWAKSSRTAWTPQQTTAPGAWLRGPWSWLCCWPDQAISAALAAGSTCKPGPIVVDRVIFLRYRPLELLGLSRRISSIAAS